jgi:3-methyl-2-oxobutanoate hydroxymethyltransferase
MPYNTDKNPATALKNARLLLDAGADSVKLEGPRYDVIEWLKKNAVEVVGHTGLTPQTATSFKQVGNSKADAERVLEEAKGIAAAGAFMLVLEHIPKELAKTVTGSIPIPTIGIGAGKECDGQVLVINDAIGMGERWPPFSRQYAHAGKVIVEAASQFRNEVEQRKFPE